MSDPTKRLLINKEQYDILNTERPGLDLMVSTGNQKNFSPVYIKAAAGIYSLIYGHPMPNQHCKHCIGNFLRPLHYQLQLFEQQNPK